MECLLCVFDELADLDPLWVPADSPGQLTALLVPFISRFAPAKLGLLQVLIEVLVLIVDLRVKKAVLAHGLGLPLLLLMEIELLVYLSMAVLRVAWAWVLAHRLFRRLFFYLKVRGLDIQLSVLPLDLFVALWAPELLFELTSLVRTSVFRHLARGSEINFLLG